MVFDRRGLIDRPWKTVENDATIVGLMSVDPLGSSNHGPVCRSHSPENAFFAGCKAEIRMGRISWSLEVWAMRPAGSSLRF